MNKKDIALSVGGVIATMVLAYLLYRLQQRDSAASVQAANTQAQQQQQNTQDMYSLLSTPSFGGGYGFGGFQGSAVNSTPIDTNAHLPTNGDPTNDNAAGDSILTTLLGDLTSSLSNTNESGLIIPTLNSTAQNSLNTANIPTTAAQQLGQGGSPDAYAPQSSPVNGGVYSTPIQRPGVGSGIRGGPSMTDIPVAY